MSEEVNTFRCSLCPYNTKFKSNLTRHVKTHLVGHPPQPPVQQILPQIMAPVPQPVPQQRGVEGGHVAAGAGLPPDETMDLDEYINMKLREYTDVPVKVPKGSMTGLMNSTPATFVAGAILGYMATGILPMLLMNLKKNAPTVAAQPPAQAGSVRSNDLPIVPLAST